MIEVISCAGISAGVWLCRFKEDRALMDIAGKGASHSAGYREAPPEED